MNIYRIADLNIGINTNSDFTKEYLKDYQIDATDCDFSVTVNKSMIEYEKKIAVEAVSEPYFELTAILREICKIILAKHNGFFLHCSCFEFEGHAYIFTAKSGTGKSTHTRLWRKYFGDRITMINDDKPIVRYIDDKFYIYGTPWSGKHRISNNIKAPIKAIFYLNRGIDNKVVKCDPLSSITKLLSQTVLPDNKAVMNTLLDMMEKLITQIPVYDLYCDISKDAVDTVYNAIKEL